MFLLTVMVRERTVPCQVPVTLGIPPELVTGCVVAWRVCCSVPLYATGVASWFCCGPDSYPGACGGCGSCTGCFDIPINPVCAGVGGGECYATGACGPCDNIQHHAAWQNLAGFPGCVGCPCTPQVSCGTGLTVIDPCLSAGNGVTVQDHGPGACTAGPTGCHGLTNRIIDLTPAAFSVWHDLTIGLFEAEVWGP